MPYAVSAIPAFEGGADPAVFVGVQGFMVSSFSQNKDLAKSFVVDYMSQEGPQLAAYQAGGRAPAQLGALAQVAGDVDLIGFAEAAANGIPQPAIPAMGNVGALGPPVNTLRGGDGPPSSRRRPRRSGPRRRLTTCWHGHRRSIGPLPPMAVATARPASTCWACGR